MIVLQELFARKKPKLPFETYREYYFKIKSNEFNDTAEKLFDEYQKLDYKQLKSKYDNLIRKKIKVDNDEFLNFVIMTEVLLSKLKDDDVEMAEILSNISLLYTLNKITKLE